MDSPPSPLGHTRTVPHPGPLTCKQTARMQPVPSPARQPTRPVHRIPAAAAAPPPLTPQLPRGAGPVQAPLLHGRRVLIRGGLRDRARGARGRLALLVLARLRPPLAWPRGAARRSRPNGDAHRWAELGPARQRAGANQPAPSPAPSEGPRENRSPPTGAAPRPACSPCGRPASSSTPRRCSASPPSRCRCSWCSAPTPGGGGGLSRRWRARLRRRGGADAETRCGSRISSGLLGEEARSR